MKKKLFSILFLLLSITLISACGSKKDADQLVKDYVQEKYGFSVDIIEREEANSGDRTFAVKQTEAPELEFKVYLSGTKVDDDTYFATKKGIEHAQKFFKQYKEKLGDFGYNEVIFLPSTASQNGFNISVETNEALSLNNQDSLDHLLEFIDSINVFDSEVLNKENIDDLTITTKDDKDLVIILKDLHTIKDEKTLMKQLNKDTYLQNRSLFEKDKPVFAALETELKEIGYKFKNGITLGQLTGSILCMEENIKNGECTGGYEVNIEGPKEAESLFQLVQILKNLTSVKIKDAFLPGGDQPVKLENLETITTIEQIEEVLAGN